jgi:hypothetical protein
VSERTLYLLQNLILADIPDLNRYAVAFFHDLYQTLSEYDTEYPLYYSIVENAAVELIEVEVEPVTEPILSQVEAHVDSGSIPSGSWTRVPYNSEVRDKLSEYSDSAQQFTASYDGHRLVRASLSFAGSTAWNNYTKFARLGLFTQGGTQLQLLDWIQPYAGSAEVGVGLFGAAVAYVEEGTTLELRAYQNSGISQSIIQGGTYGPIYSKLEIVGLSARGTHGTE